MYQTGTCGKGRTIVGLALALVFGLAATALAKGPDPSKPGAAPPKGTPGTQGKPLSPSLKRALQQSPPRDQHAVPPPPGGKSPLEQTGTPTIQLKPGEVPKIEFDTPVYDFGRIKAGQDVVHDFWFTNTGNGPLEILQVKPS